MKYKSTGDLEDWGPPRKIDYIKILICATLVIIVCFFMAMGIFASMIAYCISSLFAGFSEALGYAFWALIALYYTIWLLLTDWGQLAWWLFLALAWFLSAYLL